MRQAAALGFYPRDIEELKGMVNKFLVADNKIAAKGVIVPHAGYMFSGDVAGKTFASIDTSRYHQSLTDRLQSNSSYNKKTFVILCPNHTGNGRGMALSNQDWETPLGVVKVNKEIVADLQDDIPIDEDAHMFEHSLEVQLPFLQVLYDDFDIVPICLSYAEFDDIEELAQILTERCRDCFFIASSDFIHFGPNYGYEPVKKDALNWVYNRDHEMIDLICEMEAKEFYDTIVDNGYTVCGFVPIVLLMLVLKALGVKSGRLVDYKTSYDVHPSNSFVSYAGIIFE